MGKDFEQYLPLVMGPVLKAAALKPEVALLDSMYQYLSSLYILVPKLSCVFVIAPLTATVLIAVRCRMNVT